MSYKRLDIYEKTIQILIFICFVGKLLLDPSISSSSSFMTSSFLIQALKIDKRLFKNWVLHISSSLEESYLDCESLIFCCSHLLFSYYESSFFSCVHCSQSLLKVITSFKDTFLEWMNPMILGGHSRWLSPLLHSPLLLLLLQVVLWFERPL